MCVGLVALLLWMWVSKWEWMLLNTPAVPVSAMSSRSDFPGGFSREDMESCLVLEWEVGLDEQGNEDIGDLEQRLVTLRNLHLDMAYHIIVCLTPICGRMSPRIPRILGRRFPEYTFLALESSLGKTA
jgi:hypothetical protein